MTPVQHACSACTAKRLRTVQHLLAELPILADAGYQGAGHGVWIPVPQPKDGTELSDNIRAYNRLLRGLRFQGERGFALMTGRWKVLRHVTMSPRAITELARCVLVLIQFEHKGAGGAALGAVRGRAPRTRKSQRGQAGRAAGTS